MLPLPVWTLLAVFVATAVRQWGRVRIAIWQIMLAGACVVLAGGSIAPSAAVGAVNGNVMLFLFGMFVVGEALEESGYLAHISYAFLRRARTPGALLALVICGAGALSAVLMNDTMAIIGTPVVLLISRRHGMAPRLLLLALAFAVTTGSVMSPIGNPQNLLIALHGGIANPFLVFLRHLFLPTGISLWLAYHVLRAFYPGEFHDAGLKHSQEPIRDHRLAVLAKLSLRIVVALSALKIIGSAVGMLEWLQLTHIALAASVPVLVLSGKRWRILRRIDWTTLVFFAAMFVLMASVWQTGFIQSVLGSMALDVRSRGVILGVSIAVSQLISNVPLVALYQPLLLAAGAGTPELMALAAGSTIAGNLFLLGAASNVIIVQNAEQRGGSTIGFLEFARAGIPLTLLQTLVYYLCLRFL
jgi:Na+/H+ antiporter NhaD/arsenite permease-like protein